MNNPPGWTTKKPVIVPISEIGDRTGRVKLQTEKHDAQVKGQGIRVTVYRTMLCPRVKSIDGAEHEIDCTICRNGFIDRAPLKTWAYIQQQTKETPQLPEGYYDRNEVMGTFLQGIELQYFTLVELCDYTEIFFEMVKRQNGPVDVLKYRACVVNWVEDSDGKAYYVGNDFDVDINGSIRWKANKGPVRGTIYITHYEHFIQYRATRAVHVNRFAQKDLKGGVEMVKMNEAWALSREYHVTRTDAQGNALPPNKIRSEDEDED